MVLKAKQLLKRSGFIVAMAKAIRAGRADIKKLCDFTTRNRKVQAYLRNNSFTKLQIGTSHTSLNGWLNTDLHPANPSVIYLDATHRFPFKDNTFDYVYSEHMIEHLDYRSAVSMLRESFRVLRPGGRIRISTPNLRVLVGLLSEQRTAQQNYYINFMVNKFLPAVDSCKEVFVINNAFRAWGHQFLYDPETLRVALAGAGFENIEYYPPGISDDENLRDIELHGKVMGSEEINQFVAFAMEGQAPNPKREQTRRQMLGREDDGRHRTAPAPFATTRGSKA